MKVPQKEIIQAVADKTGFSKKDAATIVAAFVDVVKEQVAAGNSVGISQFGTIKPRARAEQQRTNPRTKQPMTIPATTVISFTAASAFKEMVAGTTISED